MYNIIIKINYYFKKTKTWTIFLNLELCKLRLIKNNKFFYFTYINSTTYTKECNIFSSKIHQILPLPQIVIEEINKAYSKRKKKSVYKLTN